MPRALHEWQDEIAAEMLADLESISGISIGEMLADDLAQHTPEEVYPGELERISPEGDFEIFPVYEEPTESEDIDVDSDEGSTRDYFDELFDDLDIDTADAEDMYGDEGV